MFAISENVEIKNLEKTGCTRGHIRQCISDWNKRGLPNYTYCGKRVQKGTVTLYTKNGDFALRFDVKDGWARELEIL